MKFKFLEHTADIKFQAFGETLEKAFENSALALKKIIAEDTKVKSVMSRKINVQGKDNESLLYNFLEEFLFLLDSRDFLVSSIDEIKINKGILLAKVKGDKASNYSFSNAVKAITYNDMFVRKEKGKWVCQVVVDV